MHAMDPGHPERQRASNIAIKGRKKGRHVIERKEERKEGMPLKGSKERKETSHVGREEGRQ
jgi:hypothetical protein